jgi:hypothetical protein
MNMQQLLLLAAIVLAISSCRKESPAEPEVPLRSPLSELPADLAAVTMTVEGNLTAPYVMLELNRTGGFNGYVAVNGEGKPVWYFRTQGGAGSFTRRSSGSFVFLDSKAGLVEVTAEQETLHILPQEQAPGRHIHHDVTTTPLNTILFIADEWKLWNDSLVNGAALWEWNPESGTTVKRWSSFDHLNPDLDRGERSSAADWLHPNSLSFGPRGNILVSMHFLNQIISIASDYQSVEWRLGGIRATIPVTDPFSGQHTAQEIKPGRVLMFDNGYERTAEKYSRVLELEIAGTSSRIAWQWRPAKNNWSRIISSARRMPNGNTLAGFGQPDNPNLGSTGPIEVFEVTNGGEVLWHLVLGGSVTAMYRATPLYDF